MQRQARLERFQKIWRGILNGAGLVKDKIFAIAGCTARRLWTGLVWAGRKLRAGVIRAGRGLRMGAAWTGRRLCKGFVWTGRKLQQGKLFLQNRPGAARRMAAAGCAGVVMLATVVTAGALSDMTVAVAVRNAGETIGYVQEQAVADTARQQVLNTVQGNTDGLAQLEYQFEVVHKDRLSDASELAQTIIASEEGLVSAYGLYINDELAFAATDAQQIQQALAACKAETAAQYANAQIAFNCDVETRNGVYTEDVLRQDVAQAVGALNLSIKALVTETIQQEMAYETVEVQDDTKNVGYSKTIAGQTGQLRIVSQLTYIDGRLAADEILEAEIVKAPVTERIIVGTKPVTASVTYKAGAKSTQTAADSGYIWPVNRNGSNCYVSCGYWGYQGHTGVDIAAYQGTDIYAAKAGTVTMVKTTGGYGKQLIITHADGTQARYAHCSQLYVSAGDTVEQGDVIAAVGQTGNATGPHLHFEVLINGSAVNPRPYLGY